jgi:hypothetical protein
MRRIALLLMLAATVVGPAGAPAASAGQLPGIQTNSAPWIPEWPNLALRLKAIGLPALSAEGTVEHIHAHLDIYVGGLHEPIPAGIGFGVGADHQIHFISELHTHRFDGVIHIESPRHESFTLGQFFDVYGVRLTATCLGGYCNSGTTTLRAFANGKEWKGDPRTIPLTAHEEIVLAYGAKAQLPKHVPSSFAFAQGL